MREQREVSAVIVSRAVAVDARWEVTAPMAALLSMQMWIAETAGKGESKRKLQRSWIARSSA